MRADIKWTLISLTQSGNTLEKFQNLLIASTVSLAPIVVLIAISEISIGLI